MVGYNSNNIELPSYLYGTAGAASGIITRACLQPLDVVKIRFQVHLYFNTTIIIHINKLHTCKLSLIFWNMFILLWFLFCCTCFLFFDTAPGRANKKMFRVKIPQHVSSNVNNFQRRRCVFLVERPQSSTSFVRCLWIGTGQLSVVSLHMTVGMFKPTGVLRK